MSPGPSRGAGVPGYPQRRVLDLTAPVVPPPVVGSTPTRSTVSAETREQTERELAEDRRSERRLLLWELLALLAVAAVVAVRALWLL